MAKHLVRASKPWVIPSEVWKRSQLSLLEISQELDAAIIVAKPSDNLYIGKPVGNLDAVSAGITNLASHGEMAVGRILASSQMSPTAMGLINLLPTKVEYNGEKIGEKKGKLLNHFGYRKVVMNLVPDTLEDHAWIACALSYSPSVSQLSGFMFDPIGGGLAGGSALATAEGAIFRGSGISQLVSPEDSLFVSLLANGIDPETVAGLRTVGCGIDDDFFQHPFYKKLLRMLNGSSDLDI